MFTLAHLSDPHLAPLPQPRWGELMGKRITGYINWRRRRCFIHDTEALTRVVADVKAHAPNHIAVTGDIANIALPQEYTRGRAFLESLGDGKTVSFVPGNHDIYVAEGALYTARQFYAFMVDDQDVSGFPYVRRRGDVALIGLTTGVTTAPFLATGWLGATQLAVLAETLKSLKAEGLFRVVLIHHPPVTQAARHKRLMDADIFLRVLRAHGAELVLHGHDHLNMLNWLEGPGGTRVPAVGVPSASALPGTDKDAAGYNLYRIDGARGDWRCEVISRALSGEGEVKEKARFTLAP